MVISRETGATRPAWRRPARRMRRLVLGHRRVVAAVLAAVAVLATVSALGPPEPPGTTPRTAPDLSPGERLVAAHPGLSPIPVRIPDAEMASLLRPGDTVTLLATDTSERGSARVIATGVEILQTVPESSQNRVTTGAAGRLIIVGVTGTQIPTVTAAAVRSVLTYAWER